MTANSTISLYTQSYYDANMRAIENSSGCGNIAELVEIANYIYVSIKATSFPFDIDGIPTDFRDATIIDETTVQTDLDELRAGVFNCYRMIVSEYLIVHDMQLTAGEWYDPYVFERYYDDVLLKERWRLILTRAGTQALSIQVMNDNDSYWYTPGSFIDQGDGTWLIDSWNGSPDTEGTQVNYQFIYGALPISQILKIPADVMTMDSYIAYGIL